MKKMYKYYLLMFLLSPLTSLHAQQMSCKSKIDGKAVNFVVTGVQQRNLEADITIEGSILSGHYYITDHFYDGHQTGLMTGEAISIKYDNAYGNIRNVVVTANVGLNGDMRPGQGWIRSFHFGVCRGAD